MSLPSKTESQNTKGKTNSIVFIIIETLIKGQSRHFHSTVIRRQQKTSKFITSILSSTTDLINRPKDSIKTVKLTSKSTSRKLSLKILKLESPISLMSKNPSSGLRINSQTQVLDRGLQFSNPKYYNPSKRANFTSKMSLTKTQTLR